MEGRNMEKFLNKKVGITTCMGGAYGAAEYFKGVLTSFDDDFVCINGKTFICRKFILAIDIK